MAARDIFISHSSGDAEVARALRAVLEAAGYTCWMAPDDIIGTETWTEQILGAIADSKAMIVLVSTASNRSPHVSREVNLALGKERAVLPIRIENVAPGGSLEYLLSLVQRVDAFPPPISDHGDRILRRLGTFLELPASAGSSPAGATPPPTTPTVVSPPPAAVLPPPAAVLPPPAAAAVPPSIVVSPTSVVTPGLSVSRPAQRSGPPLALLAGGGAVALVLAVVLGMGLLNPSASPKPSAAPASQSAIGSSAPTEVPTSITPTTLPLNTNEQLLASVLPTLAAGPPACTTWRTPPGGEAVLSPSGYAASTARLTCPGPTAGGPPIEYALYQTKAALDADYDSIMTAQGVAAGGACVSAIPANAEWNFPTYENSGKLACFERNGSVQYVWTQRELRVLVQWLAPDNATGFDFWKTWTRTLNPAEAKLLADLPSSVDDLGPCIRAADRYYETALAILACPRESGQNSVYYARFTDAAAFPNDPMTGSFDSILTSGGFPDDTATGCYDSDPVFGRYTWGYTVNGTVGSTEGYLGCYKRTDSSPATAQYVWTSNRLAVMGLWNAPDLKTGIEFFDDWIGEIK